MDSLNFMERGDYSGAVRRITTAIEAQTEAALRQELLKRYSPAEVDTRLEQSKNDLVLS
jgi:vacuolar-type H+-ATPase subunit C/Vma6